MKKIHNYPNSFALRFLNSFILLMSIIKRFEEFKRSKMSIVELILCWSQILLL